LAFSLEHGGGYRVLAFVDDDPSLWKRTLQSKPVYSPEDIAELVQEKNINEILLAMPHIAPYRREKIIQSMHEHRLVVRDVPSIDKIASGELKVSDISDVDIYDLLLRNPIKPDRQLLQKNVVGKVVLITGAGGSLGSELSRQALAGGATMVVLFELNEYALYSIDRELRRHNLHKIAIVPILGNILDEDKVRNAIRQYQVQTIYHAAAYKHVPMVEANPKAGLVNNVIGTLNLVRAAAEFQVETFVLISTDKAVRPTNIMGASKRMAELVLQAWAERSHQTIFTMVRFGNVLNSSGSVIPLFREQIAQGGPVTVTHPDITRFFMLIPEAVELVIQAGAMAIGGEVFVLDMGQPVKIDTLARRMIQLSGKTVRDLGAPEGDIEIHYTGLREGEKLYEELLIGDDDAPTAHPAIKRAHEEKLDGHALDAYISAVAEIDDSQDAVKSLLTDVVVGYQPYARDTETTD
jgi:UDP-N-acetylglucosamine 4,6-dehydratase